MELDAHELVNDAKLEEIAKKQQKLNKYKAKYGELK